MGWTETYYNHKLTQKERRQVLNDLMTWETETAYYKVIDSSIKNNVYYAAIEHIKKEDGARAVFAAVVLLSQRRDGLGCWYGVKEMTEMEGPNACECPVRILDKLTETASDWANNWRARCYENASRPKLSALDAGTIIEFICPYDTSSASRGETVRLEKRARRYNASTGRTTYRWMQQSNGYSTYTYWPPRLIPKQFTIIERSN